MNEQATATQEIPSPLLVVRDSNIVPVFVECRRAPVVHATASRPLLANNQAAPSIVLKEREFTLLIQQIGAPGKQGPPGDNEVVFDAIAGTDLDYPRVVKVVDGVASYADLNSSDDVASIVGFTTAAVSAGGSVSIKTQGQFYEARWTWAPGRIYASANGQLTQTVPTTGALVEVARVISPTTIQVGVQVGILRAA